MITIAGAGLAGLATAYELLQRGVPVTVYETSEAIGASSVSRFAGGMLAPYCEGESAEAEVVALGADAGDWWAEVTPVTSRGTLVVVPARDRVELNRFSRLTDEHSWVDEAQLAALEPALGGRFRQGLFYGKEKHLDPRRALRDLAQKVQELGGRIQLACPAPERVDLITTGPAAKLKGLRPVRGEMAILSAPDVEITRTIRLLHPRIPIYLVPRGQGLYMLGGTMVESSSDRPASLRALCELFNAAYTLHPGFAEAAVIEIGAGLRPAFADNLPRLLRENGALHLNGLYRHGFLLAPAMAKRAATLLIKEIGDENHRERRTA